MYSPHLYMYTIFLCLYLQKPKYKTPFMDCDTSTILDSGSEAFYVLFHSYKGEKMTSRQQTLALRSSPLFGENTGFL